MKENKPLTSASENRCHICGQGAVELLPGYGSFHRVTSDCKLWSKGGRLGICQSCGTVQKPIDQAWQSEVEEIYEGYSVYHQGAGGEQSVFENCSGQACPRSTRILEKLKGQIGLPETGRLLDVGCGNGNLLRSFSGLAPRWTLVGTELHDRHRQEVESIAGVEGFYHCRPEQVPGKFDLITMIHVLEHIPHPVAFLTGLQDKLRENGSLILEIPNYRENPFDLLISDHCTHFTDVTIRRLLLDAGYEVVSLATDWVPKELTVAARWRGSAQAPGVAMEFDQLRQSIVIGMQWLEAMLRAARAQAKHGSFGLFGTSIAGTWLFGELQNTVDFFVDEDPHRAGKSYLGRPVYHPGQVPGGSHVFLALPHPLAVSINQRLSSLPNTVTYHLSPDILLR